MQLVIILSVIMLSVLYAEYCFYCLTSVIVMCVFYAKFRGFIVTLSVTLLRLCYVSLRW
jgi:hypothetical protein